LYPAKADVTGLDASARVWDTELDAIGDEAFKVCEFEKAAFAALQSLYDGDEELYLQLQRIDDADIEYLISMNEEADEERTEIEVCAAGIKSNRVIRAPQCA
jgi:hypothetical protein